MTNIFNARLAIYDAVSYIDKSLDNVAGLDSELTWTNAEVIEVLRDIRKPLAAHTSDDAIAAENTISKARETLEHALMQYGLGGTLTEWVDIHDAIDTYTRAIAHHTATTTTAALAEGTGVPS